MTDLKRTATPAPHATTEFVSTYPAASPISSGDFERRIRDIVKSSQESPKAPSLRDFVNGIRSVIR